MRYIELLNSIAITIIRIYKYQISGYFCKNCRIAVNTPTKIRCNNCNDLHSPEFLVCPECGKLDYSWICENCGENGDFMISIEVQLEEIKEEIEKTIKKEDYFNEIDEENDKVEIALKIINYVNNFIKEN